MEIRGYELRFFVKEVHFIVAKFGCINLHLHDKCYPSHKVASRHVAKNALQNSWPRGTGITVCHSTNASLLFMF